MLHTVNKAPHTHDCLDACLRVCGDDAAIVLIEDGVYAALVGSDSAERLCARAGAVYALQPDLAARGLIEQVRPQINVIDYTGFVQLCCEHASVQSWY